MNDITINVGGQAITGWSGFEVDSNLFTPADAFSLTVERIDRELIRPGLTCTLELLGRRVLTGVIDDVSVRGSRSAVSMSVTGRDRAALLVDASARPEWSWSSITLVRMLKLVADHVQLGATVTASTAKFSSVKAELGESCWQFLERYARRAGVLIWLDPDGTLRADVPTYRGAAVATLRVGDVLDYELTESTADRYSEVNVLGQYDSSEETYEVRGSWKDADYPFFKPLWMTDSEVESNAMARTRARYEGERRKWEAFKLRYSVRGVEHQSGLWTPGNLVEVDDQRLGVKETMLVASRKFVHGRQTGLTTQLELRRREVFFA